MPRRSKRLRAPEGEELERLVHDGTSQADRRLAALDPSYARIDERTTIDHLRFVYELCQWTRIEDATGACIADWSGLFGEEKPDFDDLRAYLDDPTSAASKAETWGRPHFALLLAFARLLRHPTDQLNQLTKRHLDHHFEQVIGLKHRPAMPDRVAVSFLLVPGAEPVLLRKGTKLKAPKDSGGRPRRYVTERDIVVNHAQIAEVRSIYVDREVVGLREVREQHTGMEALSGMVGLALEREVDTDSLVRYAEMILLGPVHLHMSNRELLSLVPKVTALEESTREIELANAAMSRASEIDFAVDTVPLVDSIDDLYDRREDPRTRVLIADHFDPAWFESAMAAKRRLEAGWAEVNGLLARVGRRARESEDYELRVAQPTDFDANLAEALAPTWPVAWPKPREVVTNAANAVHGLQHELSMTIDQLSKLASVVRGLTTGVGVSEATWAELEDVLVDAHRHSKVVGALADARGSREGPEALAIVVREALGLPLDDDTEWAELRGMLIPRLGADAVALLDRFQQELVGGAARGWGEVYEVLALVAHERNRGTEPVPQRTRWRNLYANEDAKAVTGPSSTSWKSFGHGSQLADPLQAPSGELGFAMCSPLLALGSGTRTIVLTLRLDGHELDDLVLRNLLRRSSADAPAGSRPLIVQVTTQKGWIELDAELSLSRDSSELTIEAVIEADVEPVAPLASPDGTTSVPWPTLRLLSNPTWAEASGSNVYPHAFLAGIVLSGLHLKVQVDGLTGLRLRNDEGILDPKGLFMPFGMQPAAGSSLYIGHPELVHKTLSSVTFEPDWVAASTRSSGLRLGAGEPPRAPVARRARAGRLPSPESAETGDVGVSFVDHERKVALGPRPLPIDSTLRRARVRSSAGPSGDADASTRESRAAFGPAEALERRLEPLKGDDPREWSRYLRWELRHDLGHASYPALMAEHSARLAARAVRRAEEEPSSTQEGPDEPPPSAPVTPMLKGLRVGYVAEIDLKVGADGSIGTREDRVLHVHPFGTSPLGIDGRATLFPCYHSSGELYIGVAGLCPPQNLTLSFQLVEGTSNAEVPAGVLEWSHLDGDRWVPLEGRHIVSDGTRGLTCSGIIELALDPVAPSTRMPPGLHWIRVTTSGHVDSVCDVIDIRTQVVTALFSDQGNAEDHYASPLPSKSITELDPPQPKIARVEQPYPSYGGRGAEEAAAFYTRVSERLRHRQRALSAWDYERLVLERFPQIYKVKCLQGGVAGERRVPGRVDVVVIPDVRGRRSSESIEPRASSALLGEIEQYLSSVSPMLADVRVRNPHYVSVKVRLGVRFSPGRDQSWARQQLNEDLNRFLSPWAHDGGADIVIGGRLYSSSIIDYVDRLDYVDYLAPLTLIVDGMPRTAADNYFIEPDRPDAVLVAAPRHHIESILDVSSGPGSTHTDNADSTPIKGIGYMRIGLDFKVG